MGREITYQQEFIAGCDREEAETLMKIDWDEIDHPAKGTEFSIDWDTYQKLEDMGGLKVFTARSNGTLVGYFSVALSPSLNSKSVVNVVSDAFYLHPEYRKGFAGVKLFKFVEKCLKEDGLNNLVVTSTEAYPIDNFLTRLGYSKAETLYQKEL